MCDIHECMYVCMRGEWCACVCSCMWRSKVDVQKNHPLSLVHLIHWSKVSQSNPEFINTDSLQSLQPAYSGNLVSTFQTWNYKQTIKPTPLTFTRVLGV